MVFCEEAADLVVDGQLWAFLVRVAVDLVVDQWELGGEGSQCVAAWVCPLVVLVGVFCGCLA